MSDTDINATVNVTEDIYADVDSTAMSAAVIDDGDSIVVPAEVDFGQTLDTELEDNDLIDVPVDESVGIAGDHRVLLHRDAANQHPMSAITGLNETIAGINTALSDRITQVEAETADLDVDMASALLRIGDLQDQVDGNITTWFYAAEPAMNLPPVALDPSNPHDTGWDTIDKKNAHRGDLYYNTLTGYAYRFAYADGDFGWMRITDTDVVKALADAARAQDTADSKRRVFYTTPYPPYDKGDLWVQGTSGDILVCNTSKAVGEAYDFADWAKASKYTDDTVADIALASANGKNTVYHQASQPTGGTYKKGDTWFDTDDDYTMYTYDGSLWVKEQFGNEAIADLSITNGKIANATIEYGKIKSVDAGKITVGDLSANRIKASVITAVNNSTETSGGSSLKISADKVNIEGAAIFTSGRLSETSLDNAYDANGAAADALSDAKDYADDTAADALADAKGYADTAVSDKAGKSDAVARTQRIYYRKTASGAPSPNTTWLSTSGTGYDNWSLKVPQMTSGTTKYPYLYTAVQTQTVSQVGGTTCSCSDVLLDDTTTVIDGGTIITGSLNANRIGAGDISADRMKVNSISAINGNTGSVQISASKVNITGTTIFNAVNSDASAKAAMLNSELEIGGRNLIPATQTWKSHNGNWAVDSTNYLGFSVIKITWDSGNKDGGIWAGLESNYNAEIKPDTDYVLSFWAKADANGRKLRQHFYPNLCASGQSSTGQTSTANDGNITVTLTTEWQRYWVRWHTLSSISGAHNLIVGRAYTTGTFYLAGAKLELGNKATDWTPAPEDVQAEIDAKKSVHTLNTNYSFTYAAILTYSEEGYSGGWFVASSAGVKVGDTVRLKVTVSDMSEAPVYVIGTATAIDSKGANHIQMISHGLDTTIIDGGNILTNSIGANQIASNAITIGKIDSDTTNKINAGNTAANKLGTTLQPILKSWTNNSNLIYYELCKSTIACNSNGAKGSVHISGTIGGYINTNQGYVDITIGCRGIPPYAIVGQKDSTISTSFGNIVAYYDSNYIVHVYLVKSTAGTYSKCVLELDSVEQFERVATESTTAPTGTKFFDLSTATTEDSRTATSYITHINDNGIRIHPSSTENNSVVINSDGMEVFKGGTGSANSVAKYGDTVRVGKESSGYAVLDSEGMDVYLDGTSVAHYGDYARVGKDGEANTRIAPNEVTISASDNINALRITPDGNTQTIYHSITREHLIDAGKTYTFTQPSAIPSGTTAKYTLRNKSNSLARFEIKKGTSKSTTSVTTPFSFQYSATTTQVTIKNTGSAAFYLQDIGYYTTEVSPLTEVGGVLALGQYPSIGTHDVLDVGYGSSSSTASCFSVTNYGLVSCRELDIQENNMPINLAITDGTRIDALSADASNNLILGRGWWAKNTSGYNTYIEGYQTNIWGRNKIATNMAITQGSDKRLKKDIKDLEDVKDFVMDLKPVEFKYEFASDKDKHMGFIAQDVEKSMDTYGLSSDKYGLITEITGTDNIQYKGLNYTEFIPICIKMIQEQQQEIDALKEALNEVLGN